MVGEPVLEVRHLNSYYEEGRSILGRKGKRRQVLHDVSFQIARGRSWDWWGRAAAARRRCPVPFWA